MEAIQTTQIGNDQTMCLEKPSGAVRFFVTTLCLIAAVATSATAAAQVVLKNSVQKVETFVNEAGEPERRLVDADSVVPGDELRYTITFMNDGGETVDAGSVVITNPIPDETEYLDGTAFGSGTDIVFSVDAVAPPMIAPASRASDPSGHYNLQANSSAVKYRRFMTRCTQNRMGIGIRMWPGPAKPS